MFLQDKKTYLKDHRLADVIALIQVLAFDKYYHRSVKALDQELQGKPKSAGSWDLLAKEHPEFFRVKIDRENDEERETPKISLISRHVRLSGDTKQSDALSPDLAKKFFETAIELHDIQKDRSRRLIMWLPLIVALISILGSIVIQYQSNRNQSYLKHYEVELKPKQDGYASFMKGMSRAYYMAQIVNPEGLVVALEEAENGFYVFEPFLSNVDRVKFWNQYTQFSELCTKIFQTDSLRGYHNKAFDTFQQFKNTFRTDLYRSLFETKSAKLMND